VTAGASRAESQGVTLTEPYARRAQQREADFLGMYLFLASEIMLFGAIFALLFFDRVRHPGAAEAAAARLDIWIGTANTAILLTSSLFVALSVIAARAGKAKAVIGWLAAAALFGLAFMGLKGLEYAKDFADGVRPVFGRAVPSGLFINLYYTATVLHAVHLTVGVGLLTFAALRVAVRRTKVPGQAIVIEMTGLYWHFVDVVWVFLFPLLYLPRA
jgi:cytochrome c oxidase subunit 3